MTTLDLRGANATEAIEQVAKDGQTELSVDVAKTGEGASATVTVSHTARRWSIAAAAEWARGRGFGVRGSGKWRLGK